eukprot:gb/GECG01013751.1/.p1 GENE.gb/GECG01013751.1/~~gb/GECG01013751.1/.p1  ORF type:complete len:840 (+),score=91.83 gb/GECG01013751.1/:1-2520(+)
MNGAEDRRKEYQRAILEFRQAFSKGAHSRGYERRYTARDKPSSDDAATSSHGFLQGYSKTRQDANHSGEEEIGFSVDSFIEKEAEKRSLHEIRSIVQTLLEDLPPELVRVINEDYSHFLNVAQKLEHASDDVNYLKQPLDDLKTRLKQLCDAAFQKYSDLQRLQQERKAYKEKLKTLGHLKYSRECISVMEESLPVLEKYLQDLNDTKGETDAAPQDEDQDASDSNDTDLSLVTVNACFQLIQRCVKRLQQYMKYRRGREKTPFFRKLNPKKEELSDRLYRACQSILTALLASLETSSKKSFTRETLRDGLEICFSCMESLHKFRETEQILDDAIVYPEISNRLSTGRVDGDTRGSFSNLRELLGELGDKVENDWEVIIEAAASCSNVDFLVNCVWQATMEQLGVPLRSSQPEEDQTAPGLFAATDSTAFENGYWGISYFFRRLLTVARKSCLPSVPRLLNHKATRMIAQFWRKSAPIYFRIRASDLSSELDIELKSATLSCDLETELPGDTETLNTICAENHISPELNSRFYLQTEAAVPIVTLLAKTWRRDQVMPPIASKLLTFSCQAIMRTCLWAEAGIVAPGKSSTDCGKHLLRMNRDCLADVSDGSSSNFVTEAVDILRQYQTVLMGSNQYDIPKIPAGVDEEDQNNWQQNYSLSFYLGFSRDLQYLGSFLQSVILPHVQNVTADWQVCIPPDSGSDETSIDDCLHDISSFHEKCRLAFDMCASALAGYVVPMLTVPIVQTAYRISRGWKELVKGLPARYRMRGKTAPVEASEEVGSLLKPLGELKPYAHLLPSIQSSNESSSTSFELFSLCCIEVASISITRYVKDLLDKEKK